MSRCKGLAGIAAVAVLSSATAQERVMNVTQGPETVFDRPVEQIMTELTGAMATDRNGRVGNELVFWGYRLADGRAAYLFACAKREGVDCEARSRAICDTPAEILRRVETVGEVRRRQCREIAVAGVGDVHPGCTDRTEDQSLSVGLVQCR